MQTQTLTQTITILAGDGAPNTGLADTGAPVFLYVAAALVLMIAAVAVWYLMVRRAHYRPGFRGFGVFALLALTAASLVFNLSRAHAAPTLTLNGQDTLTITVPQGGGTASTTTTVTTSTANTTGYVLTAALTDPEPGITISLKGGNVATSTLLGSTPLELKATNAVATDDTTDVTLTFTIDGTVTPGTKTLKLAYAATDNEPAAPSTIQSFTTSECNALPVYDGTNETAVTTRVDYRGGTTQTYHIAKLADDRCWMLDNLKLGSTTAATTLTPSDTNIASNFTLPQLDGGTRTANTSTDPGNDYDTPYAYGPVTGDTGSGDTNYGYLYNWSAATAGETRTSLPGDGTNGDVASHDICPSGWRLPKGGYDPATDNLSAANEFSNLSAHMAGFTNSQDATYLANYSTYYQGWQYTGPFKGTFASMWTSGSFLLQGSYGFLWSASAYPGNSANALAASFGDGFVFPGDTGGRIAGFGVRCLLQ